MNTNWREYKAAIFAAETALLKVFKLAWRRYQADLYAAEKQFLKKKKP